MITSGGVCISPTEIYLIYLNMQSVIQNVELTDQYNSNQSCPGAAVYDAI